MAEHPGAAMGGAHVPASLAGRRILVTRPGAPGDRLVAMLERLGADVLHAPLTRIEPVDLPGLAWRLAARRYDWVLFTSANAVRIADQAARASTPAGLSAALGDARVAAVGRVTAESLHDHGVAPVVVPGRFDAEGLLEVLAGRDDIRGRRVLHPAAAGASEVLGGALARLGADVETVIAYESVRVESAAVGLRAMLRGPRIDLATFMAPSAANAFVAALGTERARSIEAASIGAVTSAALRAHGITVAVEADEATATRLVDAIVDHYIR